MDGLYSLKRTRKTHGVDRCLHDADVLVFLQERLAREAVDSCKNLKICAGALEVSLFVVLFLQSNEVRLDAAHDVVLHLVVLDCFRAVVICVLFHLALPTLETGNVSLIDGGRHDDHGLSGHGLEHAGLARQVGAKHHSRAAHAGRGCLGYEFDFNFFTLGGAGYTAELTMRREIVPPLKRPSPSKSKI